MHYHDWWTYTIHQLLEMTTKNITILKSVMVITATSYINYFQYIKSQFIVHVNTPNRAEHTQVKNNYLYTVVPESSEDVWTPQLLVTSQKKPKGIKTEERAGKFMLRSRSENTIPRNISSKIQLILREAKTLPVLPSPPNPNANSSYVTGR